MTRELARAGGVICLVTKGDSSLRRDSWRDVVAACRAQAGLAAAAGIDLFQLREPGLEAARLAELAEAALDATRGSSTRVIVNDRIDVALAVGAAGVHLRGDSIGPRAARSIAPSEFLIGRSVHGTDEAVACEADVDYLIAGTVFATPSKVPGRPLLGLEGLRSVVRAVRVPVLGIGGVTIDRLGEIATTGAAGIAAIGLFASALSLMEAGREIRRTFDSVPHAS